MSLQLRQLSYVIQKTAIIQEVNLEVLEGEVQSIVGPNGAGKSTLFSLVSGRIRPTEGQIVWQGNTMKDEPMWKRVQLGFGYLPQESLGFSMMTVLDNLRMIPSCSKEACLAVLEELGLQSLTMRRLGLLSGGERRKVDIARLLLLRAKLWILDEPFSALDSSTIQWMIDIIREHAGKGGAVLLTDHALAQVMRISDQVSILEKGRIILSGTPNNLKIDPLFIQRYSIL